MKKWRLILGVTLPLLVIITCSAYVMASDLKYDEATLLTDYETNKVLIADVLRGTEALVKLDAPDTLMVKAPKDLNVVWMKEIIVKYDNGDVATYTYYYDLSKIPTYLSEEERLDYWQELQAVASDSEQAVLDGYWDDMKDGAQYTVVVVNETTGEETTEVRDDGEYMIMGRYNSNPWSVEP